jgi:hypothetical protein
MIITSRAAALNLYSPVALSTGRGRDRVTALFSDKSRNQVLTTFAARFQSTSKRYCSTIIGSDNDSGQKGSGIMRLIVATILVGVAILGTAPSWAQAPATTQELTRTGRPGAAQQPPRTLFTIGGFNAVIDQRVHGPDSGIAYQTFEGQPMKGPDAILAGTEHVTGK